MARFLIPNGPMQTTVGFAKVATGTAIKTMLQFKPGATLGMRLVEWGISFDGSAAATPGIVELIETDVAATVTASVVADITKLDAAALNGGDPTTNLISVGTAATGYTASAEGTITAVRNLDLQLLPPTGPYLKQFPLGERPELQISKFYRVRVTFSASIGCFCYMIVEV